MTQKEQLRDKYFKECVEQHKINYAPYDMFEWFWKNFNELNNTGKKEKL